MNRAFTILFSLFASVSVWLGSTTFAQNSTLPSGGAVAECAKLALGGKYANITSGELAPDALSEAELNAVEACFSQNGPTGNISPVPPNEDFAEKMSASTRECLEKKLGAQWKTKLRSISSPEEGKGLGIQACFGASNLKGQNQQGPPKLPDDIKSCIEKAVGVAKTQELLTAGQPPAPGSTEANAIEQANCFANFEPDGPAGQGRAQGSRPQLPAEVIKCVKEKTGKDLSQPAKVDNVSQGQQIFNKEDREKAKECFPAQGFGGPGGEGPRQLPEKLKQCFEAASINISVLSQAPELRTPDQENAVRKCFESSGFQPGSGGGPGGPGGNAPPLDEGKRKCIEGLTGGPIQQQGQIDPELSKKIHEQCFGGQGGPGGPGGPQPFGGDPTIGRCVEEKAKAAGADPKNPQSFSEALRMTLQSECFKGGPQGGPGPQGQGGPQGPNQDCIARIVGGNTPPNEEQQARIRVECAGQNGPNNPGAPGGPPPQGGPGPANFNERPAGQTGLPPEVLKCLESKGITPEQATQSSDPSVRQSIEQCRVTQGAPAPGGPPPGGQIQPAPFAPAPNQPNDFQGAPPPEGQFPPAN